MRKDGTNPCPGILCECNQAVDTTHGDFEGKLSVDCLGEVTETCYGINRQDWTDQELFRHWQKHHFPEYAIYQVGRYCSCWEAIAHTMSPGVLR